MSRKKNKPKPREKRKAGRAEYDYHLPVLLKEACDKLVWKPDGIYIDGTLGGGGHTEEILSRLGPNGLLLSFDKDEQAIEHCQKKFWGELQKGGTSRLKLVNESYSEACSAQDARGSIDGILLDLGLSSRQLDERNRGFSYRQDAPLDMRFGQAGNTAEHILHAAKEEELIDILRNYGEERFATRIARRIMLQRRAFQIKTTFDLRRIVEESVPRQNLNKSLSRVFQAFRIAVNDELNILQKTLDRCLPNMSSGGRMVIISYHSLEDRIVKNFFKLHAYNKSKNKPNTDETKSMPLIKILTSKPIIPEEEELERNPRARSAKMRVGEIIRN